MCCRSRLGGASSSLDDWANEGCLAHGSRQHGKRAVCAYRMLVRVRAPRVFRVLYFSVVVLLYYTVYAMPGAKAFVILLLVVV